MGRAIIFFGAFMNRKDQKPVCGGLVAQFVAGQRALYFQMNKENRLAHINFCACAKCFLQECRQCFGLAGIQAF